MKNLSLLTLFLFLGSLSIHGQDTLFFNSFESDLGDMIVYDLDSLVSNSGAASPGQWIIGGGFFANAAISTSWYEPPGQSDDWLILPKLAINDSSTLSWEAKSFTADFRDSYQVLVSTTDSLPSSFTSEIFFIDKEFPTDTARTISLHDFMGESIYIAFRNISDDADLLMINEILVESTPSVVSSIDVFKSTLQIFPNPSDGYVKIKIDGHAFLTIYDSAGKAVYESHIHNNHTVKKREDWNGAYHFTLKNDDGLMVNKKVIFH